MVDDVDKASDEIEKRLEACMRTVNTTVPTNDTNKCIWCDECIKEKDGRRWCSADCRDEHTLYANKL